MKQQFNSMSAKTQVRWRSTIVDQKSPFKYLTEISLYDSTHMSLSPFFNNQLHICPAVATNKLSHSYEIFSSDIARFKKMRLKRGVSLLKLIRLWFWIKYIFQCTYLITWHGPLGYRILSYFFPPSAIFIISVHTLI